MESNSQIAKRFREVFLDGKWIANTNFKEQIEDLDWQKATTSVQGLNSIALLTFHIDYYVAGVLNVFNGGDLEIRDKFSFDMPEITSNDDWQSLIQRFINNAEAFAQHLDQMTEEELDGDFVNPKYGTYRRNIEGMIEHCYYHFGQVVIIRKMVE